ncbi:MFS transporter [Acidithiobacillus ferrivorans]|uniref:MFS transporter n=1 Tax=Acidithiobacillus ferrivorans TaxID=160808 RepID=UPI001C077366|nr:MFS transporter [Acidithiobacillus ferrivorans]MBU2851107.1 NarK/NasA family nitrate transporter [Acidithiobacillus ferrivorans]
MPSYKPAKGSPSAALWGATLGFFIGFGAWVDSEGGTRPFIILLGLALLGLLGLYTVLLTLYSDRLGPAAYPLILVLGALAGCGIATFSVGIGQVAYWFPIQQQGRALAIFAGLGNASPALSTVFLPWVTSRWGLSPAYLASAAVMLVGILAYIRLGHNAWYFQFRHQGASVVDATQGAKTEGEELFSHGSAIEGLKIAARTWQTWPLVLLYFTTFGGFLALTAWLPTYGHELFHLSLGTAALIAAGFALFSSLIRIPGGIWSDRWGGEPVAVISLFCLLLGAAITSFSDTLFLSIPGLLLIAAGMGVNNAAVFKMVPQYVGKAVGGAAGWVGGLGAFGGFAVPPLLGWFAERWGTIGYARGFLVYVALAIVSLGLAACLHFSEQKCAASAKTSS